MKKSILITSCLTLVSFIGIIYYVNSISCLKFDQNIVKLLVKNGNNGKIVEITNNKEIKELINEINSLNLKRKHKIPDYTGWEINLDIYYKNHQEPVSIIVRHSAIEYNGYYYGENNKMGKLLDKLKDITKMPDHNLSL